ncbi:MAG: ComEA family DNA-binding protein [Trueperaceae bacterium]|nr:ComEA family DNA-binding protein [Trueperaceae bacterium]
MRTPRQDALTRALVVCCCALALFANAQRTVPALLAALGSGGHRSRTAIAIEQPEIEVAVSGEVVEPGRYRLEFGARVSDLLAAAGGLTRQAAAALVNPADPLSDGELVHVPGALTQFGTARVSVNSGSLADLDGLPGIGPVMARRIVAHRPYSRVEDLLKVPGIGQKTLERLRALVTL